MKKMTRQVLFIFYFSHDIFIFLDMLLLLSYIKYKVSTQLFFEWHINKTKADVYNNKN